MSPGLEPGPACLSRTGGCRIKSGMTNWFSPTGFPRTEVVPDGRRGDSAFAHRMADLVEADHHVAGGVEARHRRTLMAVDLDAILVREFGADHFSKLGVGVGAERRIDAVERVMALGGVDDDAFAGDRDRVRRTVDGFDAGFVELVLVLGAEAQRPVGCDEGHVGGVAADEERLRDAVMVAADDADALVGDFVTVADRALADEAARERLIVQFLIHRRTAVGHTSREEDGSGCSFS